MAAPEQGSYVVGSESPGWELSFRRPGLRVVGCRAPADQAPRLGRAALPVSPECLLSVSWPANTNSSVRPTCVSQCLALS